MKTWTKPTPDQVAKVIGKMGRPGALRYFFASLKNPEWVEPLHQRGYFANPPSVIRDEALGTIRSPDWPEGQYLARMAAEKPEIVARIIGAAPETDNERVRETIVDIGLQLPTSFAVAIAQQTQKWSSVSLSTQKLRLSKLIAHLAKGGEAREAFKLATKLFARHEPKGGHVQGDWWEYAEGLRICLPSLTEADPLGTISFLSRLLTNSLFDDDLVRTGRNPFDFSYLRAQDFDRGEDTLYNLETLLAVKLIQTAHLAVKSFNASVDEVISKIEERPWLIFCSISLYILAHAPPLGASFAKARMLDRHLFDEDRIQSYYALLLRNRFPELSEEDQHKITGWIVQGPDLDFVGTQYQAMHGKALSEDDKELHRKHWVRDRLLWLGDNLPLRLQGTLNDLIGAIGTPMAEAAPGVSWWVPESPKTDEEFEAMSSPEVVAFLRSWEPASGSQGPSPAGVGHQLQAAAKTRSSEFAAVAAEFIGFRRTYVDALLRGLEEAAREGAQFDWHPVLSLAAWMVRQPRDEGPEAPLAREKRTWEGAREALARLITDGLEKTTLPDDAKDQVWSLIETLAEEPGPSRDEGEQWGLEPLALSMSSIRGQAVRSAIKYLRWRRQMWEKLGEPASGAMERLPAVRSLLEHHLDPAADPSLAIRAVYGESFPLLAYLDEPWARRTMERIFPAADELRPWWWAAWSNYIQFSAPYNNLYSMLRDQYALAIGRLNEDSARKGADHVLSRLGSHLIVFYWRGLISLDEDDLLSKYLRQASPKLRGEALGFIGRSLMNSPEPIPAPVLGRLRALWETRLARAAESYDPGLSAEELGSFSSWFVSGKFDDGWAMQQVRAILSLVGIGTMHAFTIIGRLAKIAPEMPRAAVECLELIVASRERTVFYLPGMNEIGDILAASRSSGDSEAIETGRRIVNRLAEYGDLRYRNVFN